MLDDAARFVADVPDAHDDQTPDPVRADDVVFHLAPIGDVRSGHGLADLPGHDDGLFRRDEPRGVVGVGTERDVAMTVGR